MITNQGVYYENTGPGFFGRKLGDGAQPAPQARVVRFAGKFSPFAMAGCRAGASADLPDF
jgi:hypothetical protein